MIKLKHFFIIPLIFFFLPAFVFYIPGIKLVCNFFSVFLYISVIILLCMKKSYKRIIDVIKTTPLKYFLFVLLLVSINAIAHSFNSPYTDIYACLRILFLRIGLIILPFLIYQICVIDEYIPYKKIIKFFVFLFWLTLMIGFVAYFGQLFNINFINKIFDFLANNRILADTLGRNLDGNAVLSNYEYNGIPRLDGLFEEPAHYAQFLFLFLPLAYSFSSFKKKLYKNQYLDNTIKLTLIPFTWLSIILTASPIFLCFAFFITIIFYFDKIISFFRTKYYIVILALLFIFFIILSQDNFDFLNLSETYLSRIYNILEDCRSFDDLIMIEPSLATRICSYINILQVFIHNFWFGIGYGNIDYALFFQYAQSPVSLTSEIIVKTSLLSVIKKGAITESLFYCFLAENGILIFIIFLHFIYKLFCSIYKLLIIYKNFKLSFEYRCASFLIYSLVALVLISFYNMAFLNRNFYLILSFIIMFIYHSKKYFVKSFICKDKYLSKKGERNK